VAHFISWQGQGALLSATAHKFIHPIVSLVNQLHAGFLTAAAVTLAGLAAAVAAGVMVGESNYLPVILALAGGVGLAVFLIMGRGIWLLIPLCWTLTGRVSVLPIPLTVQELAIAAAAACYALLIVFKKPLHKPQYGLLEVLLLLNLLWVLTMFARNPVGFQAIGSEMLGGRPYFEIVAACGAFWVLTKTTISGPLARWFPVVMTAGSLAVGLLGVLTTVFPGATPLIHRFYSGITTEGYLEREFGVATEQTGRFTTLKTPGGLMVGMAYSLYRPLTLLNPFNTGRCLLFFAGFAMIFLSGFRSALLGSFAGFVIASYFWGGTKDMVKSFYFALIGLIALILAHSAGVTLPTSAQRAVSFIPGVEWDRTAADDARGTAEWRFDMWEVVLKYPERYLRNPILGSGFGFSEEDLRIQMSSITGGQGYLVGDPFEAQLVSGAFHNGPLSTIRYAGIIGLILYYAVMIYMAVFAARLVQQCKGSPFFFLAVFLAVPIIYGLFSYTFIYGAYDSAIQQALFAGAMLRCTSESHRLWLQRTNKPAKATQESALDIQKAPTARLRPVLAHS
jgi:hypothetical protein